MTPDALIIGAGLIGAAIAYECTLRGMNVSIVERGNRPAEGATRWSQAGLVWLSATRHSAVLQLCREGLDRHRNLSSDLEADTGFRPIAGLLLARDQPALERLAAALELARPYGFAGQLVSEDEARALEPSLAAGSNVGGALCQQGHVDPVRLTAAWLAAASRLGADVRYGVETTEIELREGSCRAVHTSLGDLEAARVVVAAGAWTRSLLRRSGCHVPVLHTHAEVLETEPLPPMLSHIVTCAEPARSTLETEMASTSQRSRWDTPTRDEMLPAAVQFGAVQFADGQVLFGQVSRAVSGFLDGPLADGEARIREATRPFFPWLAERQARVHARPVAISADRLPVVGPLDAVDNLYVAAGFDSPLCYAPALARRLAALVAGESAPDLVPFFPARFAFGSWDRGAPAPRPGEAWL